MPNRFTAALDAIIPNNFPSEVFQRIDWTAMPKEFVQTIHDFSHGNDFYDDCALEFQCRTLLLCFMAEMSDEDLLEVFGI